jgi:hypothetical protein
LGSSTGLGQKARKRPSPPDPAGRDTVGPVGSGTDTGPRGGTDQDTGLRPRPEESHTMSRAALIVRRRLGGAVVLAALAAPLGAQIPQALLTENAAIPGGSGATVGALNNTAVNHAGGYAISITSSDGLSRVWGSANGGLGGVLRVESTVGDLQQTSFESFYGISNTGQVSYSASCNNTTSGSTGLDTVWLDDAPLAVEEEAVSSLAGQFWTFASRPGVTADGIPYWVGGVSDTQGGSTQLRGLFKGTDSSVVYLAGDAVPGLPFVLDPGASSVDFDYRFSELGNRHIVPALIDTGSTTNDGVIIKDGAGLVLGDTLLRELSPVPASVGGIGGEKWDNFDFVGVTESDESFITGDTDGATATDEFILVNGAITHREGDILDGFPLSGSIEGAYMNANGDLAFIWDVDDPMLGNVEALYANGRLILKEGDEVDLDGDGVIDPNAVVSGFTGISALTLGDRLPNGSINVYFTADIDTAGTTTTTDDTEGFFCLNVSSSAWTDMGNALAGVSGDPLLVGNGNLEAGTTNSLVLSNAAGSALTAIFASTSSSPVPVAGGTLVPGPTLVIRFFGTNPSGDLNLPFTMPAGLTGSLWAQIAIQDAAAVQGIALSNAVEGVIP